MTYLANNDFEVDLRDDPENVAHIARIVGEAVVAARQIAAGFEVSGDYARSFEVDGHVLLTTDPAGSFIEFGSVNNPPHGTLRKAAEAVGARVVDWYG